MHILWIVILLVTHLVAFVLGMIYKQKALEALKKENDKLRSSAADALKRGIDKL